MALREQTTDSELIGALEATRTGAPISQRVFKVRLPHMRGWLEPEIVIVPPGLFMMGDEPSREVRISHPFALGKFAVTFAEWDAARALGAWLARLSDQGWGRDRRPVINASWRDAQAYIAWLNSALGLKEGADAYRLPSEAEWEYACRAGRATTFNTGAKISTDEAQFAADKTAPVGSFPPNAFGLRDMLGNVWEWRQDIWCEDLASAPRDGSAHETTAVFCERVLRGGSWNGVAKGIQSAPRNGDVMGAHHPWFDFRIARTVA
jgi:formylglycine-generating enzyme required for sulfatase activity